MLSDCALNYFFFFFNDTATTEIYTLSPTRRSSDLKVPHIGHEKGQSLLATLHALPLLFKFGVHAVIVFVNA